jgi:putative membrane protein
MIAAGALRRPSRWLMAATAMVLAFLLAPVGPAHASGDVPVPAVSFKDKGAGAVTDADKDFVIRVRLAGLWEIAAGNLAVQKSKDPRIVTIGRTISAQHVVLDQFDRDAAKKLGIALPNKPNSDQQGWLGEMQKANATTFDQIYVDRLRAAHGKIFPAIATIRSSTRNDTVRQLAQQANQFVMTHMTLLESTGIVDYSNLPTAPAPAAATANKGPVPMDGQLVAKAETSSGLPGVSTTMILVVLAAALMAGVITTMRIFRTR